MTLTHPPKHGERVPAEHRMLGLDRRTLTPALFVIVVFVVLTIVVPRIDSALTWNDPTQAGERLALTDTIEFTPVAGWDVETGFRVDPAESVQKSGDVILAGDGITFEISPDSFEGTPTDLLDQTAKVTSRTGDPSFQVEGDRTTLTTVSGETGVLAPYSSIQGDGLAAAFVIDGTGLKITAYGPPTQMTAAAEDIREMITSIRDTDGNNR
ncbi:hypothetical protein HQO44_20930 [Rhodococcus fascians]|uniref:hypothetical protein n=1 Tax=Rhodococcoides fascians TaxID=1828 RepID=UPI0007AAC44C|nr:hypothetical protein [Rhodococcus fascians]AMY54926.1 hypothetical protein A3L23_03606 [Rhodococcus fascians D188]MBY4208919.1 hypothetical protein [Rhodococcus fascians]